MNTSTILEGDHFELFIEELEPIDDNLEETIESYKKINLVGEKYDKNNIDMKKMVDDLEKRKKTYQKFESGHQ